MSENALQKRWHLAGARRNKEFIEKDIPEKKNRRENNKIYSRKSKFSAKSESLERERNLDFMLNDNPLQVMKIRRQWDVQKEIQWKPEKKELTELSHYVERPKIKDD